MQGIPGHIPSKGRQRIEKEIEESVSDQKAALRRRLKQLRAELAPEERRKAGESCARQLWQLPELSGCSILLSYISHGAELPTDGIISEALRRGMRVAVPRVTGQGTMDFYEIRSLSGCRPGAFGILEPPHDPGRLVLPGKPRKQEPSGEETAVALLPGLAFTADGMRLGYGGGYYDRYFMQYPDVYRIGLTYRFALLDRLVCEPHDVRADKVLAPYFLEQTKE